MKRAIAALVALTLLLATGAMAGNNPNAKCAVHVRPHNAKAGCGAGIQHISDIEIEELSFSVDAFPVFYNLTEYLGCEYGMAWPNWAYSAAFTSCSDLVVGEILWPGDGAAHTWMSCQNDTIAVAGYVWLYADYAGHICLIDHPEALGYLSVLDCADGQDVIPIYYSAGAGVYGASPHDADCEKMSVEPRTWGGIKFLFK